MLRPIVILAGIALASAAAAEPVRLNLPAEPRDGTVDRVLVEQWRAGADGGDVFFGNVLQVLPAPEGGLYVLDTQQTRVFRFDAAGALVGTLGGHGEGPGEVNNVNSMVLMADGSLGIGQVLPGKVVQVAPDGTPVRSFRITDPEAPDSGFVLYLNGVAHGGDLVTAGMRWRMDDPPLMVQEMFLRRYDLDGAAHGDYLRKETAFDTRAFVFTEAGYDFVWTRFDLLPDGRVCVAPAREDYEIQILSPSGTIERILSMPYETWRRTAAEKADARRSMTVISTHYGRPVAGVEIEDTEADVQALKVLADGTLAVRTSRGDRGRPDGVLTVLDIIAPDGTFLRREVLHAPGDPTRDAIHLLADGRVVVVVGAVDAYRREQNTERDTAGDAAAVEVEVVCYGG